MHERRRRPPLFSVFMTWPYTVPGALTGGTDKGGKLMVLSGFTHATKLTLYIVQGNLTAFRYVNQVINPFVLPFMQRNPIFVFQQDNARPHVARYTLNQLTGNNVHPLPAVVSPVKLQRLIASM